MAAPKIFEDLDAWRAARDLTHEIYDLCRLEPLARDFGLCNQLRRAAVSVMNNIAEGWESFHVAEKQQFYNVARRSCGELRSMNYVLLDQKYLAVEGHQALRDKTIRCGQLISGLKRSLDDKS